MKHTRVYLYHGYISSKLWYLCVLFRKRFRDAYEMFNNLSREPESICFFAQLRWKLLTLKYFQNYEISLDYLVNNFHRNSEFCEKFSDAEDFLNILK